MKPPLQHQSALISAFYPRKSAWTTWPVIQCSGVAKSVCHRDRRSLPNRQLRCLCRTDFGSPQITLNPRKSAWTTWSGIQFLRTSCGKPKRLAEIRTIWKTARYH